MAAISQTIFSDAFSWMKSFIFWFNFHWSLFLSVQLTITQDWSRYNGLVHWQAIIWTNADSVDCRIYVAVGGDELIKIQDFAISDNSSWMSYLWDISCEDNGENWPCYNGNTLYIMSIRQIISNDKMAFFLKKGSWGLHGAHLGPTGPRWAPCWPHELCYLGIAILLSSSCR